MFNNEIRHLFKTSMLLFCVRGNFKLLDSYIPNTPIISNLSNTDRKSGSM